MLARSITAVAIVCSFACAKAAPEVTEHRLQPLASSSTGGGSIEGNTDPHAALPKLSVDEVASLIDARRVQAVDANGPETRKEYGTLPGALLLSNARSFDLKELPADKSSELVFYCGGEPEDAAGRFAIGVRCAPDVDALSAAVDRARDGNGWEFAAAWETLGDGAERSFQARLRELLP